MVRDESSALSRASEETVSRGLAEGHCLEPGLGALGTEDLCLGTETLGRVVRRGAAPGTMCLHSYPVASPAGRRVPSLPSSPLVLAPAAVAGCGCQKSKWAHGGLKLGVSIRQAASSWGFPEPQTELTVVPAG